MQAGARRYPVPPLPKQHQRKPGQESRLGPPPMYEAPYYKGSFKLLDKVALITGGDAVPPGSVATARLIGVLEVEQKDQGEPWERNDRFFAVATHAHTHQALKKLDDLRPHLLPEIESFFTHYAGLNGKRLRIVRRSGPRRARKLLKAGAKAFKAKR